MKRLLKSCLAVAVIFCMALSFTACGTKVSATTVDTKKVGVGCKVSITNVKTNQSFNYTIVGDTDSDPLNGMISNASPIGAGLMGKKVDEIAAIKTPAGLVQFKITKIEL